MIRIWNDKAGRFEEKDDGGKPFVFSGLVVVMTHAESVYLTEHKYLESCVEKLSKLFEEK